MSRIVDIEMQELCEMSIHQNFSETCPHCHRHLRREIWESEFLHCPYCHEHLGGANAPVSSLSSQDSDVIDDTGLILHQINAEDGAQRRRVQAQALPVAQWMATEFNARGTLKQRYAAEFIRDNFGEQFTYMNPNGNLAIVAPVLRLFRQLTERSAVWDKTAFHWRRRLVSDDPSSRMVS